MSYTLLSNDHKRELLTRRLLELEATHFKTKLDLDTATEIGDESLIATATENLRRMEAGMDVARAELDALAEG